MTTQKDLIERVAQAIAHKEGFYLKKKLPTVAQRCNNPGNLTHWKDRNGNPFPTANGYVQFPDEETGWRALRAQCSINIVKRRLSFLEFFSGKPGIYAGFCPKDTTRDPLARKNDPVQYARTIFSVVLGGDAERFPDGIKTPIHTLIAEG
jgi:hypothetical protein